MIDSIRVDSMKKLLIGVVATASQISADEIEEELRQIEENKDYLHPGIQLSPAQILVLHAAGLVRIALDQKDPLDFVRDAVGQNRAYAESLAYDIMDSQLHIK